MCKKVIENAEYSIFRRIKENNKKIIIIRHEIQWNKWVYDSTYMHISHMSWRRFKKSLI